MTMSRSLKRGASQGSTHPKCLAQTKNTESSSTMTSSVPTTAPSGASISITDTGFEGMNPRKKRSFSLSTISLNLQTCSPARIFLTSAAASASAEAAADVKNIRAGLHVCKLSEMVDKLKLRFFLGFIPSNPVSVMDMLAPEGAVVGTHDVIVLDDSVFFVWARHCG